MNMETGYELNVPVGDGNKDVKAIISNNEVIWERAIPTPKSGVAPLSFRATRAKPLLDWSITGKTYQAWTPSPEPQIGNNKLDNSKIEKSATVTNFAYTDSSVSFGSMTVGSTINSSEIKAEDTSYAFSFTGDTSKVTFALRCYNSSHTYIGDANKIFDEANRAVMTTLANTVYVRLYITTTVQGNISLTNLMLNKGNTVMTFEPFGYLPNTGACPVQGVGDKTGNLFCPPSLYGINITTGEVDSNTLRQHGDDFVPVVSNATYHIKMNGIATSPSDCNLWILGYDENKQLITDGTFNPNYKVSLYNNTISINATNISFVTSPSTKYIRWYTTSTPTNWDEISPMLNKGSEPLTYEPYGYKVPVVTRGKNLFDFEKWKKYLLSKHAPVTRGTIAFEGNNSFKIIANSADAYTSHLDNGFVIPINPNETYILSWEASNNNSGLIYVFPNGLTTGFVSVDNNANKKLSFQFSTSVTFVTIRFGVTNAGSSITYSSIMLNEGSEPLPYEPYHEPITSTIYLNSLLMADEVLDSTGKREVEWGKYEFTGDEDDIRTSAISSRWYIVMDGNFPDEFTGNVYCSHYRSVYDPTLSPIDNWENHSATPNTVALYKNAAWGLTRLSFNESRIKTQSEVRTFLREQYSNGTPVTAYYPLATPTTETVDVPAIPTLKGNNVIDINTEVQPSNVSITYLSSGFEPQPLKTADGQTLYTNNNQPLNTLE